MNLNLNSTTSKLYRWFYNTNQMPESLCPYFWKLIVMWILIIPYTIISLPFIIMNLISGEGQCGDFYEKPAIGLALYIMIGFLLSALFSLSIFWITFPQESFFTAIQSLGIGIWIGAIIAGIWHGIKWLHTKFKSSKINYDDGFIIHTKPKQDPIVLTFIKAKYNKYCPKIDWK
jgi:hypothetical protein